MFEFIKTIYKEITNEIWRPELLCCDSEENIMSAAQNILGISTVSCLFHVKQSWLRKSKSLQDGFSKKIISFSY
jgi:hypothetical protein